MKPIQILKDARDRLNMPGIWGQGRRGEDRERCTCCLAEAIEEAGDADYDARVIAIRRVYQAAGLDRVWGAIVEYNDDPARTLDDINKTLNLAIAIERG